MPLFANLPLWGLATCFVVAATAVWFGGWRLSGYVAGVSRKTGIGQAFAGMLMLGGITGHHDIARDTGVVLPPSYYGYETDEGWVGAASPDQPPPDLLG